MQRIARGKRELSEARKDACPGASSCEVPLGVLWEVCFYVTVDTRI